ncbi:MAG: peptide chain release factor-like protein [Patescibacteria group bacterium]
MEKELVIPADDLKIDLYRSSGPGGQNVNKVETAVRITHLPTGLTVASQVERSQAQNRERAMSLLKAKLIKLMEETRSRELSQLRTKVKPEWGNQIRSYVLNPYKLAKDHRTNVETTQVDDVLEGGLDKFIEAELKL